MVAMKPVKLGLIFVLWIDECRVKEKHPELEEVILISSTQSCGAIRYRAARQSP